MICWTASREVNLTELTDDELIDLVRLDVTRANPQAAS